ncbi:MULTISPECIES: HAMP domain-containing sensor histidine kinase [unclassified Novosphingobium]|uniref:sensor histidine kinase n=1 Tax=unclassified Novosphingobium TaxID=2644732 RepID=UPI0013570942|nr:MULTISPECIES: HAMP domain-containing sensor histidine kinase [unclassified Novosphingobium]
MAADTAKPGPMRSAAFRFALLLAAVFAIGAAALLVVVQQQIGRYATEATNGGLRAEMTVLEGEYAQLGQSGLLDAMARHAGGRPEAPYRYLLLDADGRRLFGDLPGTVTLNGWSTVEVTERAPENGQIRQENMTTLGARLPNGLALVVASDNYDVQMLRRRLGRFTLMSGLGITLFALLGGYLTGRLFLRRLARVNHAVDRIIDGDRGERLPMIGFGPEFDDLTHNLNRMLERNAAAMEALRQVTTDIAHDLRTPLSRLHQRLEQMQDSSVIEPAMVEDALAQTAGIFATFQALLRIGSLEGGVGRKWFTRFDLSELMDRIHQAYAPVAEDSGQRYLANHAQGVMVEGDAELLAQLFTNLIENAIVHTPVGSTITSSLSIDGGVLLVEVRDTGNGIPLAERANVFRRFYRLDASRNTEGSGLGLALVSAIATLHGAKISIVDSDVGLVVRATFPLSR